MKTDKLYVHELFFEGKDDISPNEKMFRCPDCKRIFYKKYDAKERFFHKAGKSWVSMSMYSGKPDYDYNKEKKTSIPVTIACPLCNNKNVEGHADESTPLLTVGFVKLKNGKTIKVK